MHVSEEVKEKYQIWPQFLVAFSAALSTGCSGVSVGWMSPAMIHILKPDSGFNINYGMISWIAASMFMSASSGCFYTIVLADKIGRKMTLLSSSVFFIISWLLAMFGNNFTTLLISRVFSGFGAGVAGTCTPLYISEISDNLVRGALITLSTSTLGLGCLFASVVGPRTTLLGLSGACMIWPIIFALIFVWAPETPYYYVMTGREEDALKTLSKLRGVKLKASVHEEMESIISYVNDDVKLGFMNTLKELFKKNNMISHALVFAITFCQQCSGAYAFSSYTETIFKEIDSALKPPDAVAVLAAVGTISTLLSMYMVERHGRKILILVSSIGVIVSNILIGTYLILSQKGILDTSFYWIAFIGIFGYRIAFASGLDPVLNVLVGELFPRAIKTWSIGIVMIYMSFFSSGVIRLFEIIHTNLGLHYAFFIFAGCSTLALIYVIFFMSETKNMSLDEIQKSINKNEEKEKI